jgi:hypothetical protein
VEISKRYRYARIYAKGPTLEASALHEAASKLKRLAADATTLRNEVRRALIGRFRTIYVVAIVDNLLIRSKTSEKFSSPTFV